MANSWQHSCVAVHNRPCIDGGRPTKTVLRHLDGAEVVYGLQNFKLNHSLHTITKQIFVFSLVSHEKKVKTAYNDEV